MEKKRGYSTQFHFLIKSKPFAEQFKSKIFLFQLRKNLRVQWDFSQGYREEKQRIQWGDFDVVSKNPKNLRKVRRVKTILSMMAAQIHKVKNNIIEILSTEMQMAAIDKKKCGLECTKPRKSLHSLMECSRITPRRIIRAGHEVLPTPHDPMQENGPPTQQYHCADFIIKGLFSFYKGKSLRNGFVCCIGLCRELIYLHSLFCSPRRYPGVGIVPPLGLFCRAISAHIPF